MPVKALKLILLIVMVLSVLVLVPAAYITADAEIIEIPLDAKAKNLPEPRKSGYLSKWEYEDPSISVKIEQGRMFDSSYMVARVKIANASQIRSAIAGTYRNDEEEPVATLAKAYKAVIAINGDYFKGHRNIGFVCKQGKVYCQQCNRTEDKSGLRYDILLIDDKGDLHILPQATNADIDAFEGNIVNGFTFGPGLVINGEKQTGFKNMNNGANVNAQRMCIAQVGELEYLLICCTGPDNPESKGLTLEEFAELVYSFEGVQNAYNLDGGGSATMVFKQDGKYQKINQFGLGRTRDAGDIVYFCTAYVP